MIWAVGVLLVIAAGAGLVVAFGNTDYNTGLHPDWVSWLSGGSIVVGIIGIGVLICAGMRFVSGLLG